MADHFRRRYLAKGLGKIPPNSWPRGLFLKLNWLMCSDSSERNTDWCFREVDIVSVFRHKDTWPLCIEFLRSGKIDMKPLITHRFRFSQKEVEEAIKVSVSSEWSITVISGMRRTSMKMKILKVNQTLKDVSLRKLLKMHSSHLK